MATQQTRPFSKDYSGLINQSVIAGCIVTIAITAHHFMKRKRRGKGRELPLGSVESWEFGYLYQGRSWAKNPSPPHHQGWPLSWVKGVVTFPEAKLCELRGVDASLYCRFIRGCFWFVALHTFTTTAILLPIHIEFSDSELYSSKSMLRALISSLVQTQKGMSLLWIHLVLVLWVTVTWIYTLIWISKGAFRYRSQAIEASAEKARQEIASSGAGGSYGYPTPHPHPQHPFHAMPAPEAGVSNRGLRLRTVMVSNVPSRLRSEKELKEYFEYYMSRPLAKPSIGLTSSTQPGLINKMVSYVFNRIRRFEYFSARRSDSPRTSDDASDRAIQGKAEEGVKPEIERVIVARKMSELASLLDRREEMLRRLETAHIKLARKTLAAVKLHMDLIEHGPSRLSRATNRLSMVTSLHSKKAKDGRPSADLDVERGLDFADDDEIEPEDRMDLLVRTLSPFVDEFEMREGETLRSSIKTSLSDALAKLHIGAPVQSPAKPKKALEKQPIPLTSPDSELDGDRKSTVWEALFSLPRATLDPYQPLVHLSALFRGRTVPSIDYYTAKVGFLTALITECRSRAIVDFEPVSTAFVTFAHPDDARRACKYLAVHPKNPLACLVQMAPDYEDLDWVRVMKQTYKAEFVKDWVVDVGVWIFTIAWIIPVSLLVALVSIQNIATVIPGLQKYLDRRPFLQEVIQSLVPTILTSLLMLLVPLILLLIAKKAHTISTLSALHDRILTRYHKFLVANILVFFCVGVTALESFFTSFKSSLNILQVIGESVPGAGPFYVGWIIFTTAIHGGFEICLFGLPLFVYPSTKRALTPRKRDVGIRPRTFNYYYWLPNHVLVIIIVLVFAVLNPLLMPFALIYFAVETVIIKNQLLHVYAKNYEGNGNLLLIRMGRYTLDGVILSQVIFLGFMAVNKKEVHVGLTAVMIVFTVLVKLLFTRIVRAKFEAADIIEAHVVCGIVPPSPTGSRRRDGSRSPVGSETIEQAVESANAARFKTWKLPKGFRFSYSAVPPRTQTPDDHKPIPFDEATHFKRLKSWDGAMTQPLAKPPLNRPTGSMPEFGTGRLRTPEQSPQRLMSPSTRPPLVTPHEKHMPWDDSARLDRSYDNPYYARAVSNHLWLPRNPVGILDLDDTVNVFRALTSDPSHGQLGEWIEGGIALSDLPSVISSSASVITLGPALTRELSGDEEISLSPVIAERVENIRKEDDVEYTEEGRPSLIRRPSALTRHTSSFSSRRRPSASLPRPVTFDVGAAAGSSRMRSPSFMSSQSYAGQRSVLSQGESPKRRGTFADPADLHGQGTLTRSLLSITSPRARNMSLAPSRGTGTSSIAVTTREAVVNEVIAEEYQATEERLREEEAQKGQAAVPSTRSWLTSWMYSRVPWMHEEPHALAE